MKKILLSALAGVFALGSANAQIASQPMIEHFTQASCPPCATQNPILYTALSTFGSANYTKITYQTSWPGVDPMNAAYPAGPQARVTYYGVTGVPNASLNGGATAGPNTAVNAGTLAAAAALMTPYELKITQTWNSASSLDVRVAIVNTTSAAISSMDRLHLGLVEEEINYAAAPGTNGEVDFFFVLRQFYDASTGTATNAPATIGAIPANDSLVYTFTLTSLPSAIGDLREVSFVGWLQNNASKAVEQSAKSQPSTIIPGALDVSASGASTAGAGYCDYAFNPVLNFTNNGTIPVTSVTAEYSINGGTPVSQTFTGNLTQGQATAINFPAATLASGTSTVTYNFTDINSGSAAISPAALSVAPNTYNKLSVAATPAPVTEGMETATLPAGSAFTRDLSTAIFDAPGVALNRFGVLDGPAAGATVGQIGGFAASNRSIYVNFFALVASTPAMHLTMEKVNLGSPAQLTFDHAYCQYQNENDRLEVQVSTDCGATWTSVWNQAGTTLSTRAALTTNFLANNATDWKSNTVDLSAYDNMNDVVIRFKATSAYGNNLFLDNINIDNNFLSLNTVEENAAEVSIMPNPVNNQMTLEFTMLKDADASISIMNALGQEVQQVTTGSFSGTNTIEVNTSDLAAGVYFLNIKTTERTTTQRFVKK